MLKQTDDASAWRELLAKAPPSNPGPWREFLAAHAAAIADLGGEVADVYVVRQYDINTDRTTTHVAILLKEPATDG